MNKKQIINIIIVFLVLMLIVVGLILINKYDLNSKSNTNINADENTEEEISTDKVEEQDDVQPTDSAKLYITCNNKSIAGYEWEGDFGAYIKREVAKHPGSLYEQVVQNIWDKVNTDYFTINNKKINDEYEELFQYSRYGYAKDDLEFEFEDQTYKINKSVFGYYYSSHIGFKENNSTNKIMTRPINASGNHIEAYCVNGKWYIFKFLFDI